MNTNFINIEKLNFKNVLNSNYHSRQIPSFNRTYNIYKNTQI